MKRLTKEEELSEIWFYRSNSWGKLLNSTLKSVKFLVLLLLLSVNTAAAHEDPVPAQPESDREKSSIQERKDRLAKISKENAADTKNGSTISKDSGAQDDPAKPEPLPLTISDPVTLQKYQTSLQAYYDYRTSGMKHRSRVFGWQLFSARLIFGVVIFLVFAGIVFAWIQFKSGLDTKGSEGATGEAATEIEASVKGIKVSSPVLGVIILVISLAFFYLYLLHVYPIEDIF
ncbi:MAG: hypothetical protein QNK19_17450 [Xanthomonadales bacterium]|nr:hypothetical protein [Xanthomonadales bacterium]